jgi:hypothetical protein
LRKQNIYIQYIEMNNISVGGIATPTTEAARAAKPKKNG